MLVSRTQFLLSFIFLIAVWFAFSCNAWGQQRWATPLPMEDERTVTREMLAAVDENDWLRAAQIADTYRGQPHGQFSQMSSFLYGWVGRHDLVQEMREEGLIRETPICETPYEGGLDLIDAIHSVVESPQIIILQERHSEVRHRLALLYLLGPLRELGFDYLAAEDFRGTPNDYDDISSGGLRGFHSLRDPIYGEAIRIANNLGYRFVPYEAAFPPPSIPQEEWESWRARNMAENIQARILDESSYARVLVFAGEGHGRKLQTERMEQNGYIPMAVVLREISGIDPISIDQTGCERAQTIEYNTVNNSLDEFISKNIEGFAPQTYDIQIQHPPQQFTDSGRAVWLESLGRQPVQIPDSLRQGNGPLILEARLVGQPEVTTPIDRLYLSDDESMPMMLSPGEYTLTAYVAGEDDAGQVRIRVH